MVGLRLSHPFVYFNEMKKILYGVIIVAWASLSLAGMIEGKVVAVHDGDTVRVLDAKKVQHKIRLEGIDAPELKQPYGMDSKKNLSDKVFGKMVKVRVTTYDKYRREVGWIYLDGENVNKYQIKQGYAWWYQQYADERLDLGSLEMWARWRKRGMWKSNNNEPPWEWRHKKRN